MVQEQQLPNSVKEVMEGMPQAFQPDKAAGANATIQFNFTGAEPGNWQVKVADGKCDVSEGTADSPTVTINSPSDVWPYPLVAKGSRSGKGPTLVPPDPSKAPPNRWGICLSGGGIRSASFCLGALQAMQRRSMLYGAERDRATYLSAVSGGSYIAGAYALLAHQLSPGPEQGVGQHVPPAPMPGVPPFSRPLPCRGGPPANGSHDSPPVTPEERYLSDHTLYLSHGPGRGPGAAWHLALGILINLLLLALSMGYACG